MIAQEQFWMVWNPMGWPPKFRHESEDSALREAKRLARNNPGQQFYVLEAVSGVEKNDVTVNTYRANRPDDWDIPF